MPTVINVKTLRQELQRVLQRVRNGERFTVLYRSRPAFQIVPVNGEAFDSGRLDEDPIYNRIRMMRWISAKPARVPCHRGR